MDLHFQTLVLALVLVTIQSAFALFFLAYGHRQESSLFQAGVGIVAMGLGVVFNLLLRKSLPPVLVVGLGNAFLFYGLLHVWQAVRMFFRRRPRFLAAALASLAVLLAFLSLEALKADARARGIVASGLYGFAALGTAWEYLHPNREEVWAGPRLLCATAFGAFAFAAIGRSVLLHLAAPGVGPVDLVAPNMLLLIAAIFMVGFIGLGFSLVLAQRLEARQSHLAVTDLLTELLNRRGFETFAQRVIDRAKGQDHGVSVILLDVDHFKQINDTYGHDAGDHVLKELGTFLRRQLRERDGAGRLGGEELAILLPQINEADAVPIAERVRMGIENLEIVWEDILVTVTVSIGVANTSEVGHCLKDLLKLADGRVYQAKQEGRNKVVGPVS